ncbi:porin family protein [Flavitalea flava]
MFNLSDKELDRLSREAAQEYDPGSLLGSRSWENLEGCLDKELGRFNPGTGTGPLRGFRRLPFYFAPAILLLIGVSYLLIKPGKNNKPSTASAVPHSTLPQINQQESTGSPPGRGSLSIVKAGQPAGANADLSPKTTDHTSNSTSEPDKSETDLNHSAAGLNRGNAAAAGHPGMEDRTRENLSRGTVFTGKSKTFPGNNSKPALPGETFLKQEKGTKNRKNGQGNRHNPIIVSGEQADPMQDIMEQKNGINIRDHKIQDNNTNNSNNSSPVQKREALRSEITAGSSLLRRPRVDDSALRAFTAIAPPIPADKKKEGLHINRTLQFGALLAPDFSSVQSQAGDKPGSSFGITVDYQFAPRWYIGSGLLYSRKNYSAKAGDYHAPYDFYQANNLHNVNFIKGSFHMLEIPLNIRYDFSVVNNTTFFVSGGVSSYLGTSEKANYYYDFFGIETCRPFEYQLNKPYLFSAANLSLGVETGISNDLSIQVAPYMKLPLSGSGVGFGQVRMSSIGISFSLKYAPVLSRKRH